MRYSRPEHEVIGLCIAIEALDDIVNHALLKLHDSTGEVGESIVRFPSRMHQSMFLIRLLDFSKEGGDSTLTGVTGSCLAVVQAACVSRSFDVRDSVLKLKEATKSLSEWLEKPTPLTLWLPSLNVNAALTVPRYQFLYIAGNQAKHNISRLTGLSKFVSKMLTDNGYPTNPDQVPLALEDFHDHLQEDYFNYYGTWLTELLNNVRWGIHHYLQPTFAASFKQDPNDSIAYAYDYPPEIVNDVPRQWFWRLMNNIRRKPYLRQFKGSRFEKNEVLR